MSNIISLRKCHNATNESLIMSNGGTAVFLAVLVLSGSAIAQNNKQKDLVIWLAGHDQAIYGLGNVGFDITDIPWSEEDFENERLFLLEVIEGALQRTRWELLAYQPDEDLAFSYLKHFRRLIINFDAQYISNNEATEWDERHSMESDGYKMCTKHRALLHEYGCILCNDDV